MLELPRTVFSFRIAIFFKIFLQPFSIRYIEFTYNGDNMWNKLSDKEMIWFNSCRKFPKTVLVYTKEMKISTGHELDEFTTMPLRAFLFAMDAIVSGRIDEIFDL